MTTSHTYQTTATVAGRPAAITCEAKYDGKDWLVLPPVAVDADGADVSASIDFKTDCILRDGATAMLYGLHPDLKRYDPYFGLPSL